MYQFHGCHWHGHIDGHKDVHKDACQIDRLIENNRWDTKYHLVSAWEC